MKLQRLSCENTQRIIAEVKGVLQGKSVKDVTTGVCSSSHCYSMSGKAVKGGYLKRYNSNCFERSV